MLEPELSREIVSYLVTLYKDQNIDAIAGIESRGFLFGYPLAMALKVPFILIRKKGKLPYKKISYSYELEYGSAEIEMHEDAVSTGQNVLIHDDLLATGGSAAAAAELVKRCGGSIAGFNFLVNLSFLKGEEKLNGYGTNIVNLVSY
jgi:adenine phosphoribosyltransferase